MKSLQLLFHYYPSVDNPGLYLLAGLDMVSGEITFDETVTYYDEGGDETDSDDYGGKDDDSATGLMFGVGYEFSPQEKMSLFGTATYSMAKYDNEGLELKVGGLAASIGLRFLMGE